MVLAKLDSTEKTYHQPTKLLSMMACTFVFAAAMTRVANNLRMNEMLDNARDLAGTSASTPKFSQGIVVESSPAMESKTAT
jgi:hypothetical protein